MYQVFLLICCPEYTEQRSKQDQMTFFSSYSNYIYYCPPYMICDDNIFDRCFFAFVTTLHILSGNSSRRWNECIQSIKGSFGSDFRITTSIAITLLTNSANDIGWEEFYHYISITNRHVVQCHYQVSSQNEETHIWTKQCNRCLLVFDFWTTFVK